MMGWKFLTTLILLGLTAQKLTGQKIISSKETSKFSTYVKGNNFEGVIFNQDYQMPYFENPPAERRFTPTIKDIESVERILREDLKNINIRKNQGPSLHKKLRKYQRQYIGFISEEDDRIVFVNCNWQKYNVLRRLRGFEPPGNGWKTGFQIFFDGGSYHWNIKVNLDKKELIDLNVNGVS